MNVITPEPESRIHKPDAWIILRLTQKREVSYRLFVSWRGNNGFQDRCRMSSGADNLDEMIKRDDGCFVWPQASGSTYVLLPYAQGFVGLNGDRILHSVLCNPQFHFSSGTVVEQLSALRYSNGLVFYPMVFANDVH